MDQFFLDTVLQTFTHVLTGGFLNVHPWVMNFLTALVSIMLIGGYAVVALHPTPDMLQHAGAVTLRGMVLYAIANNWLTITDGFLNSVVWLGMQVGGLTMSPQEFLSPGRVFYLGTALSWNIYNILLDLKIGLWNEPLLGIAYTVAWLMLWTCFALLACYVLFAVIEFQLLSVYAFLMWPFMSIRLLAFLAEPLVRKLLASALRISALATLMSILIPFVVELGIPGDDMTVQSAMSLAFGVLVMLIVIWHGPRAIGGIGLAWNEFVHVRGTDMDGDTPVTALEKLTRTIDALEQRVGVIQRWEDRLGSSLKAAWRARVFAGVMLCVNVSLGWWAWQPRPEIAPYVFIFDADGRVLMEGTPGGYTVTDTMILNRLEEWVKDARTRDNDRVVLQRQWTRSVQMTENDSEARREFNAYMDAEVPSIDTQMRAELTTTFKGARTRGRYRLEWRERTIAPSGRVTKDAIWEGEFDVTVKAPKTIREAETLRYGLLITNFSWGERLTPGGA